MTHFIKRVLTSMRRAMKYFTCFALLAPFYYLSCLRPVEKGLVVLADGHQDKIPYSMRALREKLESMENVHVVEYFRDYSFCNPVKGLWVMLRFMPLYARAEYVFLCDCFVPVTCCRKRKGTRVVQLWHSCGLMKKVGVDSPEDANAMMKTQYRNTDVFTASSDAVSDVLATALRIPRENFSTAGVSRMDLMYRKEREARLRRFFYRNYPQYRGKKILLWAPTFRGGVHFAFLDGQEEILRLQEELKDTHAILIKTHRFAKSTDINSDVRLSAEQLLAVADGLITDYSSIYFDYLYYRKPVILFAPDLEDYEQRRGLYPDYARTPGYVARDEAQLRQAILTMDEWADENYRQAQDALWQEQMEFCDGHSTEKLLTELGLLKQ